MKRRCAALIGHNWGQVWYVRPIWDVSIVEYQPSNIQEKYGWRDSNPHASRRQILSLVRLPISPHPRVNFDSKFQISDFKYNELIINSLFLKFKILNLKFYKKQWTFCFAAAKVNG